MTEPDPVLVELAQYALREHDFGDETLATARLVLADSLGCAALASTHEACRRVLGSFGSVMVFTCPHVGS